MTDPIIPRCEHGRIVLGCPEDDCKVQNDYLREQQATLDAWDRRMTDEARKVVRQALGLPVEESP